MICEMCGEYRNTCYRGLHNTVKSICSRCIRLFYPETLIDQAPSMQDWTRAD